MNDNDKKQLTELIPALGTESPTFAGDFIDAIGLHSGDHLEIMTPQFGRADGVQVPVLDDLNYWNNLHREADATLLALGFLVWKTTEKGRHWLFPADWYNIIPNGYPITTITGNQEAFKRGETSKTSGFNCLAFGFIKETHPV